MTKNRRWVLASYPQGAVKESDWTLTETEIPEPGPGEILVRATWLSVDPYLKNRMVPPAAGGAGMKPGELMAGGGVGEVIASNHPDWKPGDLAETLNLGWQTHAVLKPGPSGPAAISRVRPDAPPQAALNWLGMPGLTAYFAMLDVCRPRPGDTVVVSAAAGGVGQVAGQLAKLAGARVVGIAGAQAKIDWCRSIGFDEMIDHRRTHDMTAAIAAACPGGVNAFFDGTGGPIHDAALRNLAVAARVAIVGRIAVANQGGEDTGLRASSRMIATRATIQGFTVFDWWHRRDEAVARLLALHAAGGLKIAEDISEGIEAVPSAFVRMMRGDNLGKQMIRL